MVVEGSVLPSLMLVVTCLGFVLAGILLFLTFIVFFIAISRAVVNQDGLGGTAQHNTTTTTTTKTTTTTTGVPPAGHALWAEVGGGITFGTSGGNT